MDGGQVWLREVRGGETANERSLGGPIALRSGDQGHHSFPTQPQPHFPSFSWLVSLPSWTLCHLCHFLASRCHPARIFDAFNISLC